MPSMHRKTGYTRRDIMCCVPPDLGRRRAANTPRRHITSDCTYWVLCSVEHKTHNGTIYNADGLFRRYGLAQAGEVDSELLFRLADAAIGDGGIDPKAFLRRAAWWYSRATSRSSSATAADTAPWPTGLHYTLATGPKNGAHYTPDSAHRACRLVNAGFCRPRIIPMAEAVTHGHATLPVRSFTILYAVFDRENGKIRPHRIPGLPKRASRLNGNST